MSQAHAFCVGIQNARDLDSLIKLLRVLLSNLSSLLLHLTSNLGQTLCAVLPIPNECFEARQYNTVEHCKGNSHVENISES